jgi:hypothetical protein
LQSCLLPAGADCGMAIPDLVLLNDALSFDRLKRAGFSALPLLINYSKTNL